MYYSNNILTSEKLLTWTHLLDKPANLGLIFKKKAFRSISCIACLHFLCVHDSIWILYKFVVTHTLSLYIQLMKF